MGSGASKQGESLNCVCRTEGALLVGIAGTYSTIPGPNAFSNEMDLERTDHKLTTISFVGVFASSKFVSETSIAGTTSSIRNALVTSREADLSRAGTRQTMVAAI